MILPIVYFPDKRLREPCAPVEVFDDKLKELVANMAETMVDADGAGLAAIQVGEPLRLFILNGVEIKTATQTVFANPEMVELSDDKVEEVEGCLSFPEIFVPIQRSRKIKVRAQDLEGQFFEIEAENFYAKAIQHENDHLLNRLLIDYVGTMQRDIIRRKMDKFNRRRKDLR